MKATRRARRPASSLRSKAAVIADACIAVRLRLLARQITKIYNHELRTYGLTIGQMNILVAAFHQGQPTPQEISHALHLEKSTLSRDVARMCARGWITRVHGGGRATRLVVTPNGERVVHRAFPAWLAAQRKTQSLLGGGAVASLRRLADPRGAGAGRARHPR